LTHDRKLLQAEKIKVLHSPETVIIPFCFGRPHAGHMLFIIAFIQRKSPLAINKKMIAK